MTAGLDHGPITTTTPAVTVIIPTLDEKIHVARAISGARALGPVWVVDSESADTTVELARAAGANTVVQPWLGHSRQKNWSLDNLPIETEWVMFLDADEIIPPELAQEILAAIQSSEHIAYRVARRNIFLGRELKYVWWFPDYQLRLFRIGTARYEDREVHEHMITVGSTGDLDVALIHENLKGVDAFIERHIRYARAEARAIAETRLSQRPASPDLNLRLAGWRAVTRRSFKTLIWYRLRYRPAIRFLWLYILRRGFLDGPQGRIYAQLISAYESMIDGFLLEHQLQTGRDSSDTMVLRSRLRKLQR
jgi:glycosyltransferase involved in cell wall biosynthesis